MKKRTDEARHEVPTTVVVDTTPVTDEVGTMKDLPTTTLKNKSDEFELESGNVVTSVVRSSSAGGRSSDKLLSLPLTMASVSSPGDSGNSSSPSSTPFGQNSTDTTSSSSSSWGRNAGIGPGGISPKNASPWVNEIVRSKNETNGSIIKAPAAGLAVKLGSRSGGLTSSSNADDPERCGEEFNRLPFVEIRGEMAQIIGE
jgi:hypothetical protein